MGEVAKKIMLTRENMVTFFHIAFSGVNFLSDFAKFINEMVLHENDQINILSYFVSSMLKDSALVSVVAATDDSI